MTEDVSLSPQQTRLYKRVFRAGVDVDVAIPELYRTLGVRTKRPDTVREMQQQVGSAVSRMNKKIKQLGFAVVPGDLKHTYRLAKLP